MVEQVGAVQAPLRRLASQSALALRLSLGGTTSSWRRSHSQPQNDGPAHRQVSGAVRPGQRPERRGGGQPAAR